MGEHIIIEAVTPQVDFGSHPVKTIVGTAVVVEADAFRDGHDLIRVCLKWKRKRDRSFQSAMMVPLGNDRFSGELIPEENTRYQYTVEAWTDHYGSWLYELGKKVEAHLDVHSEVEEGSALVYEARSKARGNEKHAMAEFSRRLLDAQSDGPSALAIARSETLVDLMLRFAARPDRVAHAPALELIVDRERALVGAWYEFFPRSAGKFRGTPSTLREAESRLVDIRDMGFDVVYLPPVHPIGETNRKGKNNALKAAPGDVGSPWAIGGSFGGHDAVNPELGTIEDFDHFVAAARDLNLEVALDFAIQCSPDHPYIEQHPEWFFRRPDGVIKYAENPPKKYQDVHHVNFDAPNNEELWRELKRVLEYWMAHGVRIFRVDNPHTKALPFWHWVIGEIQQRDPGVVFLAEAFTRPKVMQSLAKLGFTQSYTYFTWRDTKAEIVQYMTELVAIAHYFRPNFFANTPDILPPILQHGGRAAFQMRAVLAATLSPTYGIYSGYELCENAALPGKEEYLDSEKYEVRVRDWNQAGNIKELIRVLNQARRDHVSLRELANIAFVKTDNENLLAYVKTTGDDTVLVVVNLDPHNAHFGTVSLDMPALGRGWQDRIDVVDLITGDRWNWGEHNYVRLDPFSQVPAHLLHLVK
ncbi:MAG: alpha-1,4-glucan--maltose-1-phosphate maltosyltransferase [Clostridia bacterium]|nr:alpha-1,4-glucan--maltose-1-phosphate maltosyltransferase [Deltaproteobacteria bacterium]